MNKCTAFFFSKFHFFCFPLLIFFASDVLGTRFSIRIMASQPTIFCKKLLLQKIIEEEKKALVSKQPKNKAFSPGRGQTMLPPCFLIIIIAVFFSKLCAQVVLEVKKKIRKRYFFPSSAFSVSQKHFFFGHQPLHWFDHFSLSNRANK